MKKIALEPKSEKVCSMLITFKSGSKAIPKIEVTDKGSTWLTQKVKISINTASALCPAGVKPAMVGVTKSIINKIIPIYLIVCLKYLNIKSFPFDKLRPANREKPLQLSKHLQERLYK